MPSFDEWYEWAIGQGNDWRRVVTNARRPARYRREAAMGEFQDHIAACFPLGCDDYHATCLPHHLQGDEVAEEPLPPYLTRMVDDTHLDYALERAVGGSPMTGARPLPAGQRRWTRASELLPSREDEDAALFVPARVLDEDRPSARAVFATFDEDDEAPQAHGPAPRFHERVRNDHGTAETQADYAVYRLATADRPRRNQPTITKLLLHYPREPVGTPRFPVPADAGWHPRFRAIAPEDPHFCGRTFPDGSGPDEHSRGICGENEVVHANEGIPCSTVHVISLGETSCSGD